MKEMKIKDKILSLTTKKKEENIQEVKVVDLKQFLVNGYEEIRQVKKEKSKLETELEEQKKYKQLYEATLVTLNEFKKRDDENKEQVENLKEKLNNKEDEIYNLKNELNTYKIKENETLKRKSQIENEIKEAEKLAIANYKKLLSDQIKNTKGNLSKNRLNEQLGGSYILEKCLNDKVLLFQEEVKESEKRES